MSDNIQFNYIPGSGLTAPIFSFEVNSGGQYESVDRFIIFGHVTGAGTLALATPTVAYDQQTVDGLCGPGSMLREQYRIAAANAPAEPFYLVAVQDFGTVPVWTITLGSLPGVGVATVEFCGEPISVVVAATDTPSTIAAALAAAINGYYNTLTKAMLPVTATVTANVVTVTARHVGVIMNAIDIFVPTLVSGNIFASAGVFTLVQTVVGAGSPNVAPALNVLGDDPADYIISPWSDTTSIVNYTTAMSDVAGRWAWLRQSYGHVWSGAAGSFSALTTTGLGLNDRHLTLMGKIASVAAFASIAFTTNPAAGTNVSIGGTAVAFVAASPATGQVLIGANLAATLAALLIVLQASADAGLSKATYLVNGSTLQATAALKGSTGNAVAISTTVAGTTVSGATLAGGLNGSPHPSWLWDVGFAARVAPWLSDVTTGNVSRNQTGLVVQGIRPPRDRALWPQYPARNTLNNSGISTWKVGRDGSLQIDKIVTTYRTGPLGQPDTVFRDIQKLYQVSGGLKYLAALIATEQGNKAIADQNPGNLGALTTPADIKGTFIHGYAALVNQGVFEDLVTYSSLLKAARNAQNRARVDIYNPMQAVSPLDILAANAVIYSQFPQAP